MIVFAWCILYLFSTARPVFGGNILIAMDLPSPSHQLWHYALAEGLIEKGHNITMLGPFSNLQKESERYHPILVEDVLKEIGKHRDYDIEKVMSKAGGAHMLKILSEYNYVVCNYSYETKGFKSLLNYPDDFKFDLIIIDMTIGSCFYPLIQKFNYPPTVGSTAFLLPPFLSGAFGNHLQPAYLPLYVLKYTDNMGFFQRLVNYVLTYFDFYLKQVYDKGMLDELAINVFGKDVESMKSLERHFSMLICNLNPVLNEPQPLTPNIIPVGGLHIKPMKKLPMDFQRIMDESTEGVILFCLGTNVRSDKLGNKAIETLLQAFGQLKQTVIWKFETSLKSVPNNVVVRQWVPQSSILSHPNMKLFISHGGALSTLEAAYFGVPLICIPFFIDQHIQAKNIVDRKLGLTMDYEIITSQLVLRNIKEILENPVYVHNMREISKRIKDQQHTPLETAVFWMEYVMRHNGSHFLNPKSRDMSIFVSSGLDVILFIVFLVFVFIYLMIRFIKAATNLIENKSRLKHKVH